MTTATQSLVVAAGAELRLPSRRVVLYGLPILGVGFMWNMIGFYFLKFSTDVLLIAPATVGLIFAACRVWDAVSDPLAGYWSDRTRTRLGRRRPWLWASALPLGACFVAMWAPPRSLAGTALVAWSAAAVFLFYTALTAFRIPHFALGAELGQDCHDRTRAFTSASVFESIGGLIGLGAFAVMLSGGSTPRDQVFLVAVVVAAVSLVGVCVAAALLREPPEHREAGADHPWAALRDVWRNPHARRLLGADLFEVTGLICVVTTVPYACQYMLGDLALMPVMLLAFVIPHLCALPVWAPLSRRYRKRDLLIAARLIEALVLAAIFFVPPPGLVPIVLLVAVAGVMHGATGILGRSLQADVIDYDHSRTGQRKEGVYFAVAGVVAKLALAFAVALVGGVLDVAGFEPNVVQTPSSILAIRALLSLVPLVFMLVGVVLLCGFRLEERQPRPRQSTDRRGVGAWRRAHNRTAGGSSGVR